ncbi:MAG: DUF4160 domain-containing protein [Bacteroidetes bacterium]|nr:DUF4160 domain-containing protein [Bacteroidota bacterium]
MPKILIYKNIVFIIFSVDKFESRIHIHVVKKSVKEFEPAKFWMEPRIELAKRGDFTTKEINEVGKLILRFEKQLKEQLESFYSGKIINTIKIKK